MPVQQRARVVADDHRSDTIAKEKHSLPLNPSGSAKARRGNHNNLKDTVVLPSEANASYLSQDGQNGVMRCGPCLLSPAFADKSWYVAFRSTGPTWTPQFSMRIASYTASNFRLHSVLLSTNAFSAGAVSVEDHLR